eukprot:6194456-Pleurochrysis_carterae.AAC.1
MEAAEERRQLEIKAVLPKSKAPTKCTISHHGNPCMPRHLNALVAVNGREKAWTISSAFCMRRSNRRKTCICLLPGALYNGVHLQVQSLAEVSADFARLTAERVLTAENLWQRILYGRPMPPTFPAHRARTLRTHIAHTRARARARASLQKHAQGLQTLWG